MATAMKPRPRRQPASRRRESIPAGWKLSGSAAELRKATGLTRSDFRRLTGFSERGLADWESGHRAPKEPASRRLKELDRLCAALADVVKPEAIGPWLQTPNDAFGGVKPLEVIERGEV